VINADLVLERRTLAGLSQRQLAKQTGVNAMTIHRLEHGADTSALPLAVLARLAHALDLQPADLLHRRDPPSSVEPEAPTPAPPLDPRPLDHNAARLLRRIHRGEDIRRRMSRVEREITLPELINRGLVRMTAKGAALSETTLTDGR
jgi:transcriptional regulator with XRE-family HTH domain